MRRAAHAVAVLLAVAAITSAGCTRSDASPPGPTPTSTAPAHAQAPAPDPGPHPRVVSLTPSLTYIAEGLGRRANLVGVSRWCGVSGVPVVGDMRPDVERVIAARPDLILMAAYPSVARDIASLRALGFPVLDVPLATLADARAAFVLLGERLEATVAATALLSDLDAAVAEGRALAAARTARGVPRPKVLVAFEVSDGFVFSTGGDDHVGEILDLVGATNVAAGGPRTARLSMEKVLLLAPDVIIHTAASDKLPDDAAALAWWQAHAATPAVTAGRVVVWPNNDLATHGPGLAAAIRSVARIVDGAAGPAPAAAASPATPP